MKTPETINAEIIKFSHEGRGIARIDGKTHFISNALQGEEVVAKITRTHSKYNEAVAIEIIKPSDKRVTPPCEHYLTCAGCSFQHLDPTAQIKFKEALLMEQLQHAGCQPQELLPALQANPLGYRRKARLGVKYVTKKTKVLVGFRETNGRMIADLNSCAILSEKFSHLIPELSHLIGSLSNFQHIPQIETAEGDGESAIIIRHLTPFVSVDLERLSQFGKNHNIAIFLQSEGIDSIRKFWPKDDDNEYLHYDLPEYQLKLAFHPTNFIQVNREINRKMIVQALSLLQLTAKDQVLDLFCGLGNFSLPIARYAKTVLGVEGDAGMVALATKNAKSNHLKNAHFICADLNKQFEFTKHLHINKVLIDPPRSGAFEVLPHIIALQPERIVYVSCNPATLARDAEYLVAQGYQLEKAGVLDMFPHTQHVESMALFVRNK